MTSTTTYGTLCSLCSGDDIRPATAEELYESLCAGDTGAIRVDGDTVYVEGGCFDDLIETEQSFATREEIIRSSVDNA